MEIDRIITISSAHVSRETYEWLTEEADKQDAQIPVVVYAKSAYGFFIYIPKDIRSKHKDIPADLLDCVLFADRNDCRWLCLDRDGEMSDDLITYNW